MVQKRYFIGIALPSELAQKFSQLQSNNYEHDYMLYPLVPHITLVPPSVLINLHPMHILPIARQASLTFLPIKVKLTKPSMFNNRVLYAAVESNSLASLEQALVGLLPRKIKSSYYVGRAFTPHLTITQAKQFQTLPDELIDKLSYELNKILPQSFQAENLSVFTWQKPRHYTIKLI